jgi:hypothetical protein
MATLLLQRLCPGSSNVSQHGEQLSLSLILTFTSLSVSLLFTTTAKILLALAY